MPHRIKAEPHYVDMDIQSKTIGEKFAAFEEDGVYTCSRCATPLFLSSDKLTGKQKKPTFNRSIQGALMYTDDYSYGLPRQLTACKQCGQVIGHVYNKRTRREKHSTYSAALAFTLPKASFEPPAGSESEVSDAEGSDYDEDDEESDEEDGEVDEEDDDDDDDDEDEEDEDEDVDERGSMAGRIALAVGTVAVLVGLKSFLLK